MKSAAAAGLVLALVLGSCQKNEAESEKVASSAAPMEPSGRDSPSTEAPSRPKTTPFKDERFTWMQESLGAWYHRSSESGEYRMPEVMCGGVALFDHDNDEDIDVFLVQGGTWNDLTPGRPYPGHALLRNDGNLRFTDVTGEAGVSGADGSYCMGAVAADYDNDGDQDLFVAAFDRDFLYQNEGGGRFKDVTEQAGVGGGARWTSSAAFADVDCDGWLDLYVVNYVEYSHELNRRMDCGENQGRRDYCSPRMFNGIQDFLYMNHKDGTFKEVAREVGMGIKNLQGEAKGLGVVATDADLDGDVDLFVANDSTANFLFINDGTGRFVEDALVRGCAYAWNGEGQAGMGLDSGDFDGDGDFDLWVVHLDLETNALYVNDGKAFFSDRNKDFGLAEPSRGNVGFGTDFFDFDNDGDLDLIIAHGHVIMHAKETGKTSHFRQRDQLLENDGSGHFRLLEPKEAGSYFDWPNVTRGLATGDLDFDGDLDVVISARDEHPILLRNNLRELRNEEANSILLKLEGTSCNKDAVGALVAVEAGGRRQIEEVRCGSSYQSRNDLRLHFGLLRCEKVDRVEVRWPGCGWEVIARLENGSESVLKTCATRAEAASAAKSLHPLQGTVLVRAITQKFFDLPANREYLLRQGEDQKERRKLAADR